MARLEAEKFLAAHETATHETGGHEVGAHEVGGVVKAAE